MIVMDMVVGRVLLEGEKDGLIMLLFDKVLLDELKICELVELYVKVCVVFCLVVMWLCWKKLE